VRKGVGGERECVSLISLGCASPEHFLLGSKVLGSEECLRTLPLRARRARGEMDKKGEMSEG
jgi:hypothetical protein